MSGLPLLGSHPSLTGTYLLLLLLLRHARHAGEALEGTRSAPPGVEIWSQGRHEFSGKSLAPPRRALLLTLPRARARRPLADHSSIMEGAPRSLGLQVHCGPLWNKKNSWPPHALHVPQDLGSIQARRNGLIDEMLGSDRRSHHTLLLWCGRGSRSTALLCAASHQARAWVTSSYGHTFLRMPWEQAVCLVDRASAEATPLHTPKHGPYKDNPVSGSASAPLPEQEALALVSFFLCWPLAGIQTAREPR
jgi:hypothetical protein